MLESMADVENAIKRVTGMGSVGSRLDALEESMRSLHLKINILIDALVKSDMMDVVNAVCATGSRGGGGRDASAIQCGSKAKWNETVAKAVSNISGAVLDEMNVVVGASFTLTDANQSTIIS